MAIWDITQRYGKVGKELKTRKAPTDKEFGFPDRGKEITVTRRAFRQDEHGNNVEFTDVAVQLFREACPEEYRSQLSSAITAKRRYDDDKQQLSSEMQLVLGKSRRATVTQSLRFEKANETEDVVTTGHYQ